MNAKLIETEHWEEFKRYYEKAATLQKINVGSELGRDTSEPLHVDDPLQHHITIYDTVDRCFAGFSNALQQVWYGSDNPKKWQAKSQFDGLRSSLPLEEWLWLFMFHRITGSGASFSWDHGFRNTIIPELAEKCSTVADMTQFALVEMASGRPIFTSIGNTIPMFPKPQENYKRASEYYIGKFMRDLVHDFTIHVSENPQKYSIRELVDWINDWHKARKLKCFHFQMTAFVMDVAEYFPDLVSPYSRVNYGKNAVEALSIIFGNDGFKNKNQFLDAAMDRIVDEFRSPWDPNDEVVGKGKAMSLEDVACDYIRYIGCYVPKGYEHLEPWQVTNNAKISYPKHWTYEKHLERKKNV